MKQSPVSALAQLCDDVLLDHLRPGLKTQIGRLHEKGIGRPLMSKLLKQFGATPFVLLAAQAEWDRLEKERLQGK